MASWYECKFKYNKEDQKGGFTTITEIYLVDAVSFTDAEARIYKEVGSEYPEFVLLSVSKYRMHELIYNENCPTWYRCKISLTSIDEKAGKEKKIKQNIMVSGNNVKEAYESIQDLFGTSVSDYEILDIVTTSIVEVLPYFENQEIPAAEKPIVDEKAALIADQAEG